MKACAGCNGLSWTLGPVRPHQGHRCHKVTCSNPGCLRVSEECQVEVYIGSKFVVRMKKKEAVVSAVVPEAVA